MPPQLSFIAGNRNITGTTQGSAVDPAAARVEELIAPENLEDLIASLKFPEPRKPLGKGRRRTGLILGGFADALRAQSGGRSNVVNTVLGRDRAIKEENRQLEAEKQNVIQTLRIRDFEARRAASLRQQTPDDVNLVSDTVVGTQRLVDDGTIPETALNQPVRLRIATDPATGRIKRREFLGIATGGEPTTRTFDAEITAQDVAKNPDLAGQEGERWKFTATVDDKTGMFENVTPVRPVGESLQVFESTLGTIGIGKRTGQVTPIIDPSGERVESRAAVFKEFQFRHKQRVELLGKDLEPSIQKQVSEAGTSLESIAWAMRRYRELGGPQLLIGNQWLISEDSKQARAAIAGAMVPVRRWLFGAALTPGEKTSAADIITDLENAVNPGKLEANLVELANLMWRSRRSPLEVAGKSGRNVSNFEPEMRRMIFRTGDELMFEAPSILGEEDAPPGGITMPGGGRVVVDENGDLKIEEP